MDNTRSSNAPTNKYQEIISTLPTVDTPGLGKLYLYQGMLLYTPYVESTMKVQVNFKAQPNDIVLCSFPRSGTGWLKALAFAIVTRSKYSSSESPLHTNISHALVPAFEGDLTDYTKRDPDMPLLSTHITYSSLPSSIISSGCKIIYICRDVKDVIVSFYHITRRILIASNREVPENINQIYESYCDGLSLYGPYWDHVLGYWNASQENPENVLFLKYEDLKKNPVPIVKKMAEFMGYPFSQEEESLGNVEKLIELCSIKNVSNVAKTGMVHEDNDIKVSNAVFFRKGDVGDWKNYFSIEMGARLDAIVNEKFKPFGLSMGAASGLESSTTD